MARSEQFRTKAAQLVSALEARWRVFERSSKAEITVSQLKEAHDALRHLFELPDVLQLGGEEPLSLTEAHALVDSSMLDMLHNILSRVQWRQFRSLSNDIVADKSAFATIGSALDSMWELLHACERVQPSCDFHAAASETFARYCHLAQGRCSLSELDRILK